jgi:hypothetical protein
MDISALFAPMAVDDFFADHYGRAPVHIARSGFPGGSAPLDWPRLNTLLALRSHWVEANIKLIMNGVAIEPQFYMDETPTRAGPTLRADPAKVGVFLAMGASLVADSIEEIEPRVREIADLLAAQFGARAEANAYCSFQNVQAFASHCDLHEVFVLQCEGEKDWNIYANRAAAPVETLTGDDAQAVIDAAKGEVLMRVRMRPGDLLYLPRGYYHDALASSEASLHVTFSVAPLTGRILFRLLEALAMEDEAFREYLPDGRRGDALAERLDSLAERVARLVRSGRLRTELESRQRALVRPTEATNLPQRKPLSFFARTQRQAELRRDSDTVTLLSGTDRLDVGALHGAVEWLLDRPAFSLEEMAARFPACDAAALRDCIEALVQMGLVFRYKPEL